MNRIRCFLLEPTDMVRVWLRRYVSASDAGGCQHPENYGYHNAMVLVEDRPANWETRPNLSHKVPGVQRVDDADPRWPTHCPCGFDLSDQVKQVFQRLIYRRIDTGEMMTWEDAPAGAMRYVPWFEDVAEWLGPDGRCLQVKTPGGEWFIDSRARNCTMPDDKVHKCWIRHGVPPDITVDKNGVTCAAGAGSILCGNYHGFLRNGWLEEC